MSMTPTTRLEKWLAKIAGESVDITPKDRLETLLAKIAGDSVTITPDDSLEYWLNQIAENGGGGGGGDLSKATITFAYRRSGQGIYLVEMTLPLIEEGTTISEPCVMARKQSVDNKNPLVVTVPLYKKKCIIVPGNKNFTLEGNCKAGEGNLQGAIIVSGDCSITYYEA